jgi:hypothetical protein
MMHGRRTTGLMMLYFVCYYRENFWVFAPEDVTLQGIDESDPRQWA